VVTASSMAGLSNRWPQDQMWWLPTYIYVALKGITHEIIVHNLYELE